MNDIAPKLVWCCLQVTLVSCVATGLCWMFRRGRLGISQRISLTALVVILALTLITLTPIPDLRERIAEPIQIVAANPSWTQLPAPSNPPLTNPEGLTGAQPAEHSRWPSALIGNYRAAADWIDLHTSQLAQIVLPLVLLSVVIGGIRLAIGWHSVRRLGQRARRLRQPALLKITEQLRLELNCRRRVELREASDLSTAATIGWLRPIVLLPSDWRQWSPSQLRSVLAHELAHIAHNDFGSLALAQCSAVLHFYHPLVHSLVARLRLEQELSADAAAAQVAGGRRSYLTVLAALALQRESRPIAWPARSFLPTTGTFLRRIEMLKETHQTAPGGSRVARTAAVLVVVAAGLVAAGMRPQPTFAQKAPEEPQGEKAATKVVQQANPKQAVRTSMNHMKTIGLAMHNYHDVNKSFPPASIKGPNGVRHSWRVALLPYLGLNELYNEYRLDEAWNSDNNKRVLAKIPDVYRAPGAKADSTSTSYFVLVGEGTPFHGDEGSGIRDFLDGTSNTVLAVESKLNVPWTKPEDINYLPENGVPKLGGVHSGGFVTLFADGSARFLSSKVKDDVLHNLFRLADGNVIQFEQLRP